MRFQYNQACWERQVFIVKKEVAKGNDIIEKRPVQIKILEMTENKLLNSE